MTGIVTLQMAVMQLEGLIPRGTRVVIFQRIYWVFLVLGTLVGIVVIGYSLWKAYKYRDIGDRADDDVDRPELGELPQGSGGGRKLALSFSLSAVIVISLILWTYGTLLYVETAPAQEANALQIDVVGYQFGWEFHYPNGHVEDSNRGGALRVPAGRMVTLSVTSDDVFHNFGILEVRAKADAIPGQTTDTWFRADEPARYTARCYELCGAGHSFMTAPVIVMEPSAYQSWYANTNASGQTTPGGGTPTPTPS